MFSIKPSCCQELQHFENRLLKLELQRSNEMLFQKEILDLHSFGLFS